MSFHRYVARKLDKLIMNAERAHDRGERERTAGGHAAVDHASGRSTARYGAAHLCATVCREYQVGVL